MNEPRSVRPMDRTIEDRLPPLLEAAGAPLTRPQIFARVKGDVVDEEHLAQVLGRLVANGMLIRRERARFNSTPEFVYGTARTIDLAVSAAVRTAIEHIPAPKGARVAAIAAAAKKVQRRLPTTTANEASMPNEKKFDPEKIVEYLTPARGWINPATIAEALKVNRTTVGLRLRELAAAGRIQTRGKTSGMAYAHPDVDAEQARDDSAGERRKPRKPSRSQRLRAARPRPEPPTRQLPAVPVKPPRLGAAVPDESIYCAIEDSGVVAITNGTATLRLSPAKIDQVVQFLERTQLIWKGAPA